MAREVNWRGAEVRPARRLTYAFAGLLAGDSVLLLFLLENAIWIRRSLLVSHMGQPGSTILLALEQFVIYASCSFLGWVFVGIPVVLLFSARFITGLSWFLKLLVGAALGPLALFLVFVLLARGHLRFRASFIGTGVFWLYSVVVSTISFMAYAALLRRGAARRA
jgi:hypothetical protein